MLISFVVTEICSIQNLSMKKQKAITLKLGSEMLWFLCSTLPLIKVYLPVKFYADIFAVTEICSTQNSSMKNNKLQ